MPKLLVDCPSEEVEQTALIRAASHYWWGKYLFAIPNGGHRHKLTAVKLKAQGVKAGIPDLFLAYPAKNKCGLFVEMKRRKNSVVSDNQKLWIQRLSTVGYEVHVCYGWEKALEVINKYLENTGPI